MTRTILTYGLISGILISAQMGLMVNFLYNDPNFEPSAIVGFGMMIVVFSLIYLGIRNYRNQFGQGIISFGKALKMGAAIALVASTVYVVTWLICYYIFIPDFMERYTRMVLNQSTQSGATAGELAAKTKEMAEFNEMYKNPVMVVLLTYMEVLPVGLIISLISAWILKQKTKQLPI